MVSNHWDEQRRLLDARGFGDPVMLDCQDVIEAIAKEHIQHAQFYKNPHNYSDSVRRLLAGASFGQLLEGVCGPGLQVWRSAFFMKVPTAAEIGWHHDKHFSNGDSPIRLTLEDRHFSIFVAVTAVGEEDGCLEFIPRSHIDELGVTRDTRPFHLRPKAEHILHDLPASALSTARAAPLKAGEALLFHSATLHRSRPNTGQLRRLGLVLRFAPKTAHVPEALQAGT